MIADSPAPIKVLLNQTNMLRQILSGLAAVTLMATAYAKPITPDEALSRLKSANPKMAVPARSGKARELAHTTLTEKGNPAVYISIRAKTTDTWCFQQMTLPIRYSDMPTTDMQLKATFPRNSNGG